MVVGGALCCEKDYKMLSFITEVGLVRQMGWDELNHIFSGDTELAGKPMVGHCSGAGAKEGGPARWCWRFSAHYEPRERM